MKARMFTIGTSGNVGSMLTLFAIGERLLPGVKSTNHEENGIDAVHSYTIVPPHSLASVVRQMENLVRRSRRGMGNRVMKIDVSTIVRKLDTNHLLIRFWYV